MATTIRDVAHRAGVSIATVSRALRDATSVTPETRARVTQAAAATGHDPTPTAETKKHQNGESVKD